MTQLTEIAARLRGMAQSLDEFAREATLGDVLDLFDDFTPGLQTEWIQHIGRVHTAVAMKAAANDAFARGTLDLLADEYGLGTKTSDREAVTRFFENEGLHALLDELGVDQSELIDVVCDEDAISVIDALRNRGDLPDLYDLDRALRRIREALEEAENLVTA